MEDLLMVDFHRHPDLPIFFYFVLIYENVRGGFLNKYTKIKCELQFQGEIFFLLYLSNATFPSEFPTFTSKIQFFTL